MTPGPFRVDTRQNGDGVVLALEGELDLAGEGVLEQAVQSARVAGGKLTIDLTELHFIDSSGLRVLVRLHNAAVTDGFEYRLIAGPPQVHRTFTLCGLDRTLAFAA
jgi:anti-anti-sigma factor